MAEAAARLAPFWLAVLIVAASAGIGRVRYGSLPAALAAVRGDRIFVDDASKSIGDVHAGTKVVVQYTIMNLTSRTMALLGSSSSCSCTILGALPETLPPLHPIRVAATISVPSAGRVTAGAITLFTDDPVSQELNLPFSGRIVSMQ